MDIPYVSITFVRRRKSLADAGVSEWQTRQTQNLLWATTCGFKSRCRHSMESLEKSRDFFVARKQNQATAEPAFGFERAYTKQKQKSRSDEPAKQEVFVSEKEANKSKVRRSRHLVLSGRTRNKNRSREAADLRSRRFL